MNNNSFHPKGFRTEILAKKLRATSFYYAFEQGKIRQVCIRKRHKQPAGCHLKFDLLLSGR